MASTGEGMETLLQLYHLSMRQCLLIHCSVTAEKMLLLRTSWKPASVGRRFLSCVEMKCQFFEWVDGEVCERSKVIIPGLLKKINILEAEKGLMEKNLRKMKDIEREVAELEKQSYHVRVLQQELQAKGREIRTLQVWLALMCFFSIFVLFFFCILV